MGTGAGVGLSLLSMRFLETLLYEVRPNDPVTLGVLAAGLLGLSLLASYVPARRATRIDPGPACARTEPRRAAAGTLNRDTQH